MKHIVVIVVFIWFNVNVGQAQSAEKVESVSITVSDLDVSMQFFKEVLSFKTVSVNTLNNEGLNDLFGLDHTCHCRICFGSRYYANRLDRTAAYNAYNN